MDPVETQSVARLPPVMQSQVPMPYKLEMRGNLAQNWRNWRQLWESYEIVTNLKAQGSIYRLAALITCIGPDALEIYNGLPFGNEQERKDIDKTLELLEKHCIGETNIIYERYIFNNRVQEPGESIDTYASSLRKLAQSCNFRDIQDELVRDRIVCGIKDNSVRKKLLQESDLTLKKSIDICRAVESTNVQLKAMAGQVADEVNWMKDKPTNKTKFLSKTGFRTTGQKTLRYNCKFCGLKHETLREKCPAFGKSCNTCGKLNHFSSKCRQRTDPGSRINTVNYSGEYSDSESSDELFMLEEMVHTVGKKTKVHVTLLVRDKPLTFQLDTGATCNVMPRKDVPAGTYIEQSHAKLTMYNQSQMKPVGKINLTLVNPKNQQLLETQFQVVEEMAVPLLGLKTSQDMAFVHINYENILNCEFSERDEREAQTDRLSTSSVMPSDLQATSDSSFGIPESHTYGLRTGEIFLKYRDVFTGDLGQFEGVLHLEVDPAVAPVRQPLRRIPIALKQLLQDELGRLERMKVIAPVNRPTNWVSSIVTVKKPSGKLRICIDPKPLNKALKRSHYPMPVMEDMLSELSKAKVFTKCDVKNGFWHIVLDEESSYLTTFGSPFGRYRWLRLPFGISPAPELFQFHLDQALQNLQGTFRVADDILTIGEGTTFKLACVNHDKRFERLLKRCREKNIKLNKDKLELKATEITFIGHVLSSEGLKPDPKKVEAVMKMPKPTDVQGIQRVIGMVTYLAKFLKGLSDICEPLRQLAKKDVEWIWTFEHDQAFSHIKTAVTTAPVLKYFDSQEPTTVQCDASETGMGASLLQNGQPVAYASRALTSTERNYAQIEKEMLAILFGMNRFHQYTFGRRITVESDHKPLESIQTKPLLSAPKRLQRMLLALQRYDYHIVYKKGVHMYLADTLSRAYLPNTEDGAGVAVHEEISCVEAEVQQIFMADYLPVSTKTLQEIRVETVKDETLQTVVVCILSGWSQTREAVPNLALPYFDLRDELSVQDGVVFRGLRCVVPKSLRPSLLKLIHSSHLGIEACRRRARECVYWPSMNAHISDHVSRCETCQAFENHQQKETLIPHEVPDLPWVKIAVDIFTVGEKDFLVTVDYFSDFFEIDRIYNKTAREVQKKLKCHVSRHGIPEEVVSDNGPPFGSHAFAEFAQQYGFKHTTSSPRYPQSNGKAEAAVKVAKRLIKKALKAGSDPYLALLDYRNTPTEGFHSSPVQRLFNRRTKTLLPMSRPLLVPQVPQNVMAEKAQRVERQTEYYNQRAKDFEPLQKGDQVRVQPISRGEEWKKATVVRDENIRSYCVQDESGQMLRRNRKHLRQVPKLQQSVSSSSCPERAVPTDAGPKLQIVDPDQVSTPVVVSTDCVPEVKPEAIPVVSTPTDNVVARTRCGRSSKRPSYLQDYVG